MIYLFQLLKSSLCVNVYCIFGMLPLSADSVRLSSHSRRVHSISWVLPTMLNLCLKVCGAYQARISNNAASKIALHETYPDSSFAKALQTHCGASWKPLVEWMLCSIALLFPPLPAAISESTPRTSADLPVYVVKVAKLSSRDDEYSRTWATKPHARYIRL